MAYRSAWMMVPTCSPNSAAPIRSGRRPLMILKSMQEPRILQQIEQHAFEGQRLQLSFFQFSDADVRNEHRVGIVLRVAGRTNRRHPSRA